MISGAYLLQSLSLSSVPPPPTLTSPIQRNTFSLHNMDSPWDEETPNETYNGEAQWQKNCIRFYEYQAGYREGITAGKEGALQEGFDSGFADTGAPIGREVGRGRGISSALLALLSKGSLSFPDSATSELRDIASKLTEIRFSDICPPDLEAEAHAREHLKAEGEELAMDSEELEDKNQIESLEDMLAGMSASGVERSKPQRPSMEDFKVLKQRLEEVVRQIGLQIHLS
ncbi:hypothetical protein NMY22_g16082 [Coprinellus aureogranulatus]|nr:hypothetical protein NMY22_g16082 [Coprinellus aureogranulatus]